jgi:hypothetical protein
VNFNMAVKKRQKAQQDLEASLNEKIRIWKEKK